VKKKEKAPGKRENKKKGKDFSRKGGEQCRARHKKKGSTGDREGVKKCTIREKRDTKVASQLTEGRISKGEEGNYTREGKKKKREPDWRERIRDKEREGELELEEGGVQQLFESASSHTSPRGGARKKGA